MEKQEFRTLLEQLRHEIEHADTVDEKGRELLSGLQSDIHELLERSEVPQAQSASSTVLRLEETIAHLEIDHPTLTAALEQLLSALSNAGI